MDESGFIQAFGAKPAVDPTTLAFINAGSNVLGKALSPGTAGPSRADAGTGGWFDFGDSPFVVDFGSGNASAAPGGFSGVLSPLIGITLAAVIGLVAWKLYKKSV